MRYKPNPAGPDAPVKPVLPRLLTPKEKLARLLAAGLEVPDDAIPPVPAGLGQRLAALAADLPVVRRILSAAYTVGLSKEPNAIRCTSRTGLEDANESEWAPVMAALRQHFGERLLEVSDNVCYRHTDFTIYTRPAVVPAAEPRGLFTTNGTSAAILAPYLPCALEVQAAAGRFVLTGIAVSETGGQVSVTDNAGYSAVLRLSEVLPVLRPFAALCDPLSDGTVPAVELAKLVMSQARPEGKDPIIDYSIPYHAGVGGMFAVDCAREKSYTIQVRFRQDWMVDSVYDWGEVGPHSMLPIYDYLRSHHFAVGLEPHQYIAK